MALLPFIQSMGLPLLAQVTISTCTSSTVASAACQVVGGAYPAYATYRSGEMVRLLTRQPAEVAAASQASNDFWLDYWACFAALATGEALLRPQFPGYHHAKLLFLLWLQSRRYQGARRLYRKLLLPAFQHLQPSVDGLLARLRKFLASHDMQVLGAYAHEALTAVPVLEWFVRDVDGTPHPLSPPCGPPHAPPPPPPLPHTDRPSGAPPCGTSS